MKSLSAFLLFLCATGAADAQDVPLEYQVPQQEQQYQYQAPRQYSAQQQYTQSVAPSQQEYFQGVPVYKDTGADREDYNAIPSPEEVQYRHNPRTFDGRNTSDVFSGQPQKCGWAEVALKTPDGSEFHQAQWTCYNGHTWVRLNNRSN